MDPDSTDDVQRLRLKKVQEKNKRAQARYRQKQKEKMQNFEGQCHELREELDAIKLAYSKLENEKASLESTLGDPTFLAQRVRHRISDEDGRNPQDASIMPVRPIPQQSSGWAGYESEQMAWDSLIRGILARSIGETMVKESDVKPFESRSPDILLSVWDSLVEELRERLKLAESSPEGNQPVLDVIQAMRQLGNAYRDKQPALLSAMDRIVMREKVSAVYGPATAEVWNNVLAEARLTQAQVKRIIELRHIFSVKTELLLQQRKDIVWEIQQCTAVVQESIKRDENYSKAHRLTEQLQDSLAQEHLAKEDFQKSVTNNILSELQEARMMVTAHPYQLDIPRVCDALLDRPESLTMFRGLDHADSGKAPSLPAILQNPAVLDSDSQLTYFNAMASLGCTDLKLMQKMPDNSRAAVTPFLKGPVRSSGLQSFGSTGFNGGGRSSGFMPMTRQSTASKDAL